MERRTTQVVVAGAAVAVGLVAAGVVVASGGSADESAPVATTQTATVERRTLTAAETRDGTVGFADESTLQTQRQGVLTALAAAGATKRRGDVLFRVNQEPTVLLYGAIPAYRPMAEGTSGRDVKQLERNLKALGYKGFTVNRSFTSDTAEAVQDWQDDLGVAQTGQVALADVNFQPTAVRMGAAAADIGQTLQPGAAIADISSAAEAVTVSLEESDQELAVVGDRVALDTGTQKVSGRVTAVDAIATAAQDGTTTTTFEVTVAPIGARAPAVIRRLPEGASVDVDFAADTVKDAVAVPVKALLALSEGGAGVEVVGPGGNSVVAVTTGTFADGWVEITEGDLAEGDQVAVAP